MKFSYLLQSWFLYQYAVKALAKIPLLVLKYHNHLKYSFYLLGIPTKEHKQRETLLTEFYNNYNAPQKFL